MKTNKEDRAKSPSTAARGKSPQRGRSSSPSRTRFSEADFEKKRDTVDAETRTRQMAKAKGLKLEPKDWTKAELLNKVADFARFTQDKTTSVADLQFIEKMVLSGEQVKIVDELFHRVTQIQTISVRRCSLTDELLQKLLSNNFKNLRFVRALDLSQNTLSQQAVNVLVEAFGRRHRFRLENLDVRGNQLQFEDGLRLVQVFPYLKSLNGIPLSAILRTQELTRHREEKEESEEEASMLEEANESKDDESTTVDKPRSKANAHTGGAKGRNNNATTAINEEKRITAELQKMGERAFANLQTARQQSGHSFVRRAHITQNGPTSNPYVSTEENTLSLPGLDLHVVEVGIVVGILERSKSAFRHLNLSNNHINAAAFFYLVQFIKRRPEICSLDISFNPITNDGKDVSVVETLWKYIQSSPTLTHINMDGVIMPEKLRDSIMLSIQANRSFAYSATNHYRFNDFIQRTIRLKAKPTHIPAKFRNPFCRYDYDPEMFMKSEIGTLGGGNGLLVSPSVVTKAKTNTTLTMTEEDVLKHLNDEPDEEFIRRNRLPICDVKLDDKGFKIVWKKPQNRLRPTVGVNGEARKSTLKPETHFKLHDDRRITFTENLS